MKRLVCLLGMSLLTTAWAAPCAHADAPTNAARSDLGDKARLLQLPDPSAELRVCIESFFSSVRRPYG